MMHAMMMEQPMRPPRIYESIIHIAVIIFLHKSLEPHFIKTARVIAGLTWPPHIGERKRIYVHIPYPTATA